MLLWGLCGQSVYNTMMLHEKICTVLRNILVEIANPDIGEAQPDIEHVQFLVRILEKLECFDELDYLAYNYLGMF